MFQLFRTGDPAPLKHYFFPAGDVPVTKLLSADAMSRTFAMLVGCVRRLSWMDMCLWLSGKLSANSLEPSDSAVPLPAAKKLKTNSGASFSAEHSITAKDIFELHTLHAFLLFYRIDDIGWQPSASNSNPLLKKEMLASCPVDSKQRKLQAAINAAAIDWNLMRTKRLGPTLFGHLVRHLVSGLLPKTSDSVSSVLDHVLLGELISATSTKAPLNAGPAHSADNLPRRLDDYLGVLLDKAILAQHYHLYLAGKVKKTPAFRALQDKVARSRLEANTICLRVMIYYIEECDDDGSSRQTTAAEVASKTNGEASINPSSMDHAETTNYHAASLLFTPFGLNVGWAGLRSLTDQRRANLALAIMKFLSHRLMQYLAGERSVQRITKHARLESQTAAATFNYPTQSYHVIVVLLVQIMVFMHGTPLKDSIMSAYVEWLVLEMDKFDQLQALLAEQEGARSSKTAVTVEQFIMDNREPWSLWWLKSGTFGMLDTEGEGEGGSVSVHPLQIAEHIVGNVNMARDFLGMSRFISQLTTVYLLRRMDKRATPALILTGEHRLLRGRRYCGWLMGMYFCHYLLINVHRLAAQRKPKDYAPTAASASASSSSLASSSSTISSTTTAASAAASKLPSTDISLNGDATPRDICRFVTDNFANPEAHNPELSRLLRMLIIAARDEVANNQGSGDGVALMDSSQLPIVLMELLTAVRCFSETTMSTDTEQYRRRPFRSYAHRLSSVRRRFPFYCSLWFVTYFIGALVEGFEELAAPSMTSNNPKYFSLSQLIKELFTNDGWWTYLFPDMQQPAKSFGNDLQTEREQDPKYLNPNLYWLLMKISTLEAQYPDGCRLFFECWFDAWTAPFAVNDSSTASGADEPRVANVLVARILLLVDFYQYPGMCFDR
jgi:hypothetical protein